MIDDVPPPLPEGYTAQDRYRDFRKLFRDPEEGPRVLRQILDWCRVWNVMAPTLADVR